jgi:hypothetical protein
MEEKARASGCRAAVSSHMHMVIGYIRTERTRKVARQTNPGHRTRRFKPFRFRKIMKRTAEHQISKDDDGDDIEVCSPLVLPQHAYLMAPQEVEVQDVPAFQRADESVLASRKYVPSSIVHAPAIHSM